MVLFSLLDYWHHPKDARNSHHVLFPTLFELFFYNPKKTSLLIWEKKFCEKLASRLKPWIACLKQLKSWISDFAPKICFSCLTVYLILLKKRCLTMETFLISWWVFWPCFWSPMMMLLFLNVLFTYSTTKLRACQVVFLSTLNFLHNHNLASISVFRHEEHKSCISTEQGTTPGWVRGISMGEEDARHSTPAQL